MSCSKLSGASPTRAFDARHLICSAAESGHPDAIAFLLQDKQTQEAQLTQYLGPLTVVAEAREVLRVRCLL